MLVEPIYCEFACNYVFVYFSITGRGSGGRDGLDFSAGPQTSPISPQWSPLPALCTLSFTWHKLG